ncbi:MAG: phosphomannomutase/phosphoglucomutase [Polyangia bacterium]
MNPHVFRAYDIRGRADRDLGDELVTRLGKAIGTHLVRDGRANVVVGRDCRMHSPRLHAALLCGLCSTGIAVIDIGVSATPMLYFAVHHLDAGGGIQITGSHNPADDNGFKILRGKVSIHGDEIQHLRELVETNDFVEASGPAPEQRDVSQAYIDTIAQRIELGPRRMKVVVDAGNGVGGIGVPVLRNLGFDVTPLHCEPDGRFPNHHPDPTIERNVVDLRREVARVGAEVGIAFDGDADRLGVVDERGRMVWGDQLMILFARAILLEVPGATFVSEVKCSKALYDEIERAGGKAIMWKVGHSLIKEKMKAVDAQLAGEMSGHIFFRHRWFGFDDAVYAAARLLELLSQSEMTLADHVDTLPLVFNTPEIRYAVAEELKFEIVRLALARFSETLEVNGLDGARITWPDGGGWALVRASNTQAALVLRFEAPSGERLTELRGFVEHELQQIEARLVAGRIT